MAPFGHHDRAVAEVFDLPLYGGQESIRIELDFRKQDDHGDPLLGHQPGRGSDPSGVAAHDFQYNARVEVLAIERTS